MAITLVIIGALIVVLGLISKTAVILVSVVGALILVVALWLFKASRTPAPKGVFEPHSETKA